MVVLRDRDICVDDQQPPFATEYIQCLFECAELVEVGVASIERICLVNSNAVFQCNVNSLLIRHRRNDHHLFDEVLVVWQRQCENVVVIDADCDCSWLDHLNIPARPGARTLHG